MEKTTMSVQELSAQMGISLPKAYELVKEPGFPTIRNDTRLHRNFIRKIHITISNYTSVT